MIRFFKFKDGKLLKHQHSRPPKKCRECGAIRRSRSRKVKLCKFCARLEVGQPIRLSDVVRESF